jgi:hypothetical protein
MENEGKRKTLRWGGYYFINFRLIDYIDLL